MRVDLLKFLFIGLQTDRNSFFQEAQKLGVIHFIDSKKTSTVQLPEDIENCLKAIKILRSFKWIPQEEFPEVSLADEIIAEILQLSELSDSLTKRLRKLKLEFDLIAPLGNYSLSDLNWIEFEAKRTIQFFTSKRGMAGNPQLPNELIHLATVDELDYFVAINKQPVQYKKMVEIKPTIELSDLKQQIDKSTSELHEAEVKLYKNAKYLDDLQHILIDKFNRHHLSAANSLADGAVENTLFVISGWVPENKVADLNILANNKRVYIEEVSVDSNDIVPTCLQNEGTSRIGEDLVHVYDVPSKEDTDPSLWVLFFFALFFSMIVGDAGYGLILLLTGLFVRYKYKKITNFGERMLKLLFILSGGIIIWGILMTSFFGVTVAPDSQVRKFSFLSWLVEQKADYHFAQHDAVAEEWVQKFPTLKEVADPIEVLSSAVKVDSSTGRKTYELYNAFADNIMLELALFVGVVHIIISLMRYLKRNIAALGWIVFIVGGYFYAPSFLDAASFLQYVFGIDQAEASKSGLYLMAGGLSFALLVNLYKHKLLGIFEVLTYVIQIFSDIMSYLRLYALGLSGALITATVNEMVDGMNIVLAGLLLIVAHTVNLTLAIMGGVIHGLRLNFLEWYHYSFEGGGKRFNPLKKIEHE